MDEFTLIETLIAPRAGQRDDVLLGIGDDGAIVRAPPGEDLVIVADTIVEAVHFPRNFPASEVGYRALAVNLSDVAAMGAEPRWATLGLTMPRSDPDWLRAFVGGLVAAGAAHGIQLVGGDTTRGPLTVTVQVVGTVPAGQALVRHGARPGDRVWVTGTLGDAAAGLTLAMRATGSPLSAGETFLRERFARPTPRVAVGQALRGVATSCIDISDGLVADLGHIARRSGCDAVVFAASLPLSDALRDLDDVYVAHELALTGGDDYELCFTVPMAAEATLRARLAALGERATCVGEIRTGPGTVTVLDAGGEPRAPARGGYRHF
ncbi:MAG: thiamine-phosphate kinase [Gammaproteobacteria bacterium]